MTVVILDSTHSSSFSADLYTYIHSLTNFMGLYSVDQ